jgi:hypothetical protein
LRKLGEEAVELCLAHPVRETVRRGIEPIFAQDGGRTAGKAPTQCGILPKPRNEP